MIRRVLLGVTCLILGIVGVLPMASATSLATSAPSVGYSYDAPDLSTDCDNAVTERVPPKVAHGYSAHEAVDPGSDGRSARPYATGTYGYITYDPYMRIGHVDSGSGATASQAADGQAPLVRDARCAAKTASLEARAAEIHGALDPIAQTRRTTAALGTQEGTTVIGGGVRDLSPAQRALLQDGEMMAGGPGHAEVTTVLGARGAGLTPQEIVTTTNICPACQVVLRNEGATITGPRSAKW